MQKYDDWQPNKRRLVLLFSQLGYPLVGSKVKVILRFEGKSF